MYSSVKKGMSCIREEKFFFTPGDYPLIEPEVYRQLLLYNAAVVIPTFEGRKGHPILFKSTIIDDVLNNAAYQNLREVISHQEIALATVNCKGIMMDLDTWSDYEMLIAAWIRG
jgi:molybdenum cofactor cytidylyltransferase